jgi:hypothetical protein
MNNGELTLNDDVRENLEQFRLNKLESMTIYFNNGGDPNAKTMIGISAFESLIWASNYDVELVDTLLANKVVSEATIKELQPKYPHNQTVLSFINRYHVLVEIKEPGFD